MSTRQHSAWRGQATEGSYELSHHRRWSRHAPLADTNERSCVSGSVADHAAHHIEQVDWDSRARTGKLARIPDAQHSTRLKFDERQWHQLPWTITGLDREAETVCHAPKALNGEVPQMLRRGHESPMRASKACV